MRKTIILAALVPFLWQCKTGGDSASGVLDAGSTLSSSAVTDWKALPSQQELDQMTSHPINDPSYAYTDYRPDAPGANLDLPGASILAAMKSNAATFGTAIGGPAEQYMRDCLQTGYSPTHWPDIAIHYYCTMTNPRYCYTYATSGGMSRFEAFKGCANRGVTLIANAQQYQSQFTPVANTQPEVFQYVMFGQTNAFNHDQEQAIINAYWGVTNPNDPAECNAKRPRRTEDPSDGTHCLANKVMSTKLIGRSR